MPAKNVVKMYTSNSYYHVYNRGVAKQGIFHDAQDKKHFLRIVSRHLDAGNTDKRYDGKIYKKFCNELELLSYCLMGNHFHLLFFMGDSTDALKGFMQSLMTSYTMYYNKKYKRVGSLFQGTFKASKIEEESYLLHISRYIHRNPRNYETYFYSSYKNYLGVTPQSWLKLDKMLELFRSVEEYRVFVADDDDYSSIMPKLKYELADK